jgi:CBS domain-containing protein
VNEEFVRWGTRLAAAEQIRGGVTTFADMYYFEDQVAEVDKVKRSEAGMIVEPVTLPPDAIVRDALELMAHYKVSGVPITDAQGVLVGILTNRDLRFETDIEQPVSALMTARNLITAPVGTTLEEAEQILAGADVTNLAQAATATAKLGEIDKQLATLKGNGRLDRARIYLKEQIRKIKLASIEAI